MEGATAAAQTAGATTAAPPPAAPSTQTAGAQLSSVPAGPDWASGFKDETKNYISQKGFKTPEALAESYRNLEVKLSSRPPEDRTVILPEKMEGDAARAVWERLGAPKEAKGYELPRDEKAPDPEFATWAESTFHGAGLTKSQAQSVASAYNERLSAQMKQQAEARSTALKQADATLQKEWGQHYETNVNLAKQGAKILGLDAQSLDLMEALQGRETLFKNLQKIGVSVGESNFVNGQPGATTTPMTADQANAEIQKLMRDQKFQKKFNKGDAEAMERWNTLNQLAAPGEKSFG